MQAGKRVTLIAEEKILKEFESVNKISAGENASQMAKNLFFSLRKAEKVSDVIFLQAPPDKGLGSSVLNRIKKACGGNFID